MTDAEEITEIVRRILENLTTPLVASRRQRTRDVKTALGAAGRVHGYWVCTGGLPRDSAAADSGEWLYDLCWLSYQSDGDESLVDADLVVESEWTGGEYLDEDFQKLLLARATVRLMIFDGGNPAGADQTASRLARQVAAFRCTRDDDTWLFAAWVTDDNKRGWSFRWYTVRQGEAVLQGAGGG